ncbi:hypothetical protein V496_01938 [Pseudogymnoascus sp. VKM F-4515 (FW-2607)]|nr:hypothetical protein V496_01938 [Pseudogymnoascus sp. VKM F-4515 (FW-2607)]
MDHSKTNTSVDNDSICSHYRAGVSCPTLQPDPDIAGNGVIIAFIIAAFLTLIIYFFALIATSIVTSNSLPVLLF